jgi:myo-inositol-1(or 4)-monophosphatase
MLRIASEAALEAGKFLLKNLGKVRDIQQKGGQEKNLVTEIDKQSERMIIDLIRKHFPQHDILAEESGTKEGNTSSEFRWIIDPLDGTTNYTHSLPVFCVSIGVEHNGTIVCGAIYDPNFDELFTAERGKGAYLNKKRIRVAQTQSLNKSLLVTGFPYNVADNPGHAVEHFVHFLMKSQAVRRIGSAAIDLAYTAAGRYDGFWEVALNPWDMAAGALLVEEAGGTITDFAGNPFSIYKPEVLASNSLIHQAMIDVLKIDSGLGTVEKK